MNNYPRFFIHAKGFLDDTSYLRIDDLGSFAIVIDNKGNHLLGNSTEEECESFVKSGNWMEIPVHEFVLHPLYKP